MFKATLLGFHFLTSVLLSGYNGETVVAHNIPNEISAKDFQEIELLVLKEAFTGPAKLVIDWSRVDLEVAEGYSSGSSFSFDGKKSLHIWYSIEENNVISLTYKVKGKAQNLNNLKGYFSYVKDGSTVKVPLSQSDFSFIQ